MALPMHLVQKLFLFLAKVAVAIVKMPGPKMAQDSLVFVIFFIAPTIRFTDVPITLKAPLRLSGGSNVLLCYPERLLPLRH
jgi:hypothetical protein